MNTVESFAAVSQLEHKKSSAETYGTFYQLFGELALQRQGTHGWHTVLSRVLHFDEDDSRDVHVVVARNNQSMNLPMVRQYDALGVPMHRVPYRTDDFVVASTDGQAITMYDVRSVTGVYRNHINGIDKQYDAQYEKIRLNLQSEQGGSYGEFQCSSGNGVFELQGYPAGWILSEAESLRMREITLQQLGHAAVAS